MAQKFKNNVTGEIITVSRVRYYYEPEEKAVDLSGNYDLSNYTYFEDTDNDGCVSYENVKTVKSKTDGKGIR